VGCNCEDCHPATELGLPELEDVSSQVVVVEFFRDPDVASAEIVCTWSMSAWTCLPDQEEFQFDDPERPWFVRIEGPAGAVEIERDPFSTDPGEGWPTSCPHCYPYLVSLHQADFAPVFSH
jgi:hypothetical protein